ncbi:hypothetical protein BU23DRAFT_563378 [Bimuria novae-zelandiae CBS 107.79]|uniref:Uncharacterized protein n=1 Tax=Bimuria novae-zelandiae CBS 107.79 TaxID=1447943 RepID=A0A6A5W180_9PLEO|nr:hypothetical protein BU23DRAFT_563378 [Bimuria novae-zelandiae CBS 107.79]
MERTERKQQHSSTSLPDETQLGDTRGVQGTDLGKKKCFEFLKFSAELRNRIYLFIHEDPNTPPKVIRNTIGKNSRKKQKQKFSVRNSGRKYLGLTTQNDYQNAPKLLLLSWNHNEAYNETTYLGKDLDIGQVLAFGAKCPELQMNFVHTHTYEVNGGGLCKVCRCPILFECFHSLPTLKEAQEKVLEAMLELNNFLNNKNVLWQKAVRDLIPHTMTVG